MGATALRMHFWRSFAGRRHKMRRLIFIVAALAAGPAIAETCSVPEGTGRAIGHANLIIEDNAGDGDIGVHGYFDDEGWSELCVFDPEGNLILRYLPAGRLGELGIAGFFFESKEPEYGDWDYAALKRDFPEGMYGVRATDMSGELVTGEAWFTTVVPAMPEIATPATVPEEDAPDMPDVPVADLTVEWAPVTASQDGRPLTLTGYQVTVEKQNHDDPHGFSRPAYSIHVGPGITSVVVPAAFFDADSVYELEVLALEESGNQTIGGASFFATE
jgi:hypothetical protein